MGRPIMWSLELASELFHHFFAYMFGGEESRPSDLQAWIVEGIIYRRARSRLGRNSASRKRKSNPISRDIEEFGSALRKLGYENSLLILAWKSRGSALVTKAEFQKDHGRERCADGKESGIAEMQYGHEKLAGEIPDLARRHSSESAVAVGKVFGMAEDNFVTNNARSEVKEFATEI